MSEIVGVGVVKGIDRSAGRVTIAYDPIDGMGWPAGVMPFTVTKSALLDGLTPGERVKFRLESQQISELKPFTPAMAPSAPTPQPPLPSGQPAPAWKGLQR